MTTETLVVHTPHNWPATRFEANRATLCRWVWIGAMWAGDIVGKARVYTTDDHGDLVEVSNNPDCFNASMAGFRSDL